jgi:hypothetical protein
MDELGERGLNDYQRDDLWQKAVRDEVLIPFYSRFVPDGRFVTIDRGRLARTLQKVYSIDTIVQATDGRAVCFEEKLVRWPGRHYTAYVLETESCTNPGHESEGWMRYGQADWLLYGFARPDHLAVHLINFQKLQRWFLPREHQFPPFELDTFQHSRGRVVPIKAVERAVGVEERLVFPHRPTELFPDAFKKLTQTNLNL